MKLHFDNPSFSYQLLRVAGCTEYEAADLGECLATARRIPDGDYEAWHREWLRTARSTETAGEQAIQRGRRSTARRAFLRASSYFRAAEILLLPEDPRKSAMYDASRQSFRKALELLDVSVQGVTIPYEETHLEGHLYRPRAADARRPTLVLVGDHDATLEELYCRGAAAAPRRGFNCLAFAGPGQGEALRVQHLPARADYEVPVRAAIDWLVTQPDVDPDRIALWGVGFGGYYVARAAAFEPRVRALVIQGALHDYWDTIARQRGLAAALDALGSPALVNAASGVASRLSPEIRHAIAQANWIFGTRSAHDLMSLSRRFTLTNVVSKISRPTLILHGEEDHEVPLVQAKALYDALPCGKTLRVFSAEASSAHAQAGSLGVAHDIIFDWLEETLPAKAG